MKHILLAYFATATIYDRKMFIALAAGQRQRRKSFIALTHDIDAVKRFYSLLAKRPNKLECLSLVSLSILVFSKSRAYPSEAPIPSKLGSLDGMHSPAFSSQLTNGPNKLKRYLTLRWKHLPVTNTSSLLGPLAS
jgi:hypothetical protein